MDGTLVNLGSECQKSHVLPHMWIIDLNKCSNIIGHGETMHGKDRAREGNQKLECG
jgi:hypothetical protein